MNIEAGARVLAELLGRDYDDMREGYLDQEYDTIFYSTTGGIRFQGRKEDIKHLVAEIIKAVFELDTISEKEDSE